MRAVLITLVLVGCTYGVGDPPPDPGPGSGSDENANNEQPPVDAPPMLPACNGALYDPCTGSATQCQSGICQLYQQAGIQVCTQSCTPGNDATCPPQNGVPATCNNMGLCKPAAANACTR